MSFSLSLLFIFSLVITYFSYFKVAEQSFCRCNSARAQGSVKENMPSIERSFYLLITHTICVIFLYNWTQCIGIDGFSPLLRAQERPATLILTVTSGLRFTRARHVYNRDAEIGNWNFVLQLRTIRIQKMCQSQQFVTWDPSFCQPSVTLAQTFAGRKLKTRLLMMFSFH